MTPGEIMKLADEYAAATHEINNDASEDRAALRKAVEEMAADAELWRAYKARKDAALAAGLGRNPLRSEETP